VLLTAFSNATLHTFFGLEHSSRRRDAPDLNPVEAMWENIKGQKLANFCAEDLKEVDEAIRHGMVRVEDSETLPFSFLNRAGLFFLKMLSLYCEAR
jgi:hypothetical protein